MVIVRYPVLRTFYCKCCGRKVNIRRAGDRREDFCSYTCRSVWESEHGKKRAAR